MIRNHYLHAGICWEPTSWVQQHFYPNTTCPGGYASGYREQHRNVALTTSQGLRPGTMFPDMGCTTRVRHLQLPGNNVPWCTVYHHCTQCLKKILATQEMLWYSNGNILAPQYLGISNWVAQYFGTQRCSLCTHSMQNLQGDCDVQRA
jgi:hypothetical protein